MSTRRDEIVKALGLATVIFRECDGERFRKPLLGGAFASGQYQLAALLNVRAGLWAAEYGVFDAGASAALSLAKTREAALEQGRGILAEFPGIAADVAAEADRLRAAMRAQWDAEFEAIRKGHQKVEEKTPRKAPRRRVQVFEKSNGQCHYCGVKLAFQGRWHIEHQMPRALLGGNELGNLVAACVPCNMKKRDRTAEEFAAMNKEQK